MDGASDNERRSDFRRSSELMKEGIKLLEKHGVVVHCEVVDGDERMTYLSGEEFRFEELGA